ncbi:MAG: DNA polymerase [Zavarzinella sp.]
MSVQSMVHYLFVDMNSYFASVEQQLNPELRGKPIAVSPVGADSTACIAASYEAKRYGVKTGTMIGDAKRLCPGLIVIAARPQVYVQMHHQIVDAVGSVLPVSHVMSVDEMMCKLWGDHRPVEAALALAGRVKEAIYRQAGEYMHCSIGLATNRLLAKVAGDMKKPNGLTVIRKEDLPDKLLPLQIDDIPGIGMRMKRRLNAAGVFSMNDLLRQPAAQLGRIWGSKFLGSIFWHRLRGVEIVDTATHRRSLGHSRVLEPQLRNPGDARAVMIRLIHKAAARLRHIGYYARSIQLNVSYTDRSRWKERIRINELQDTLSLLRRTMAMWDQHDHADPKKIGVVFGDLIAEANVPQSLFEEQNKLILLAKAMDRVNECFGRHMVHFGGMFGLRERVSTRIAFGTVPDLSFSDC